MTSEQKPPASLQYSNMLFLAGHGLQTPLSAIRWATSRLRKSGENLTVKQQELLDGIADEARLLAKMFDWLLLLAKIEEGVHLPNVQDVFVHDFLLTRTSEDILPEPVNLVIHCPEDLQMQVDRTVFEALFHALMLVVTDSGEKQQAVLHVESSGDSMVLTLEAPLALSLMDVEGNAGDEKRRVVGGVSGYLLSVASSFSRALGGDLQSVQHGGAVSGVQLRLPLHPRLSSLVA